MVLSEEDDCLEVDALRVGERSGEAGFGDALLDGRDEVLRDCAADDLVAELVFLLGGLALEGLKTHVDLGELTMSA